MCGVVSAQEAVAVKLANQSSLTVPLRAKIMKPRVVSVSVWPIKHPATQAVPPLPTKADFEEYLDGIFKKQLNVTFNVTIKPAAESGLAANTKFLVADPPSPTQLTVATGKQAGNIQIYVMGGLNFFSGADNLPATGWTNPGIAFVWMPSDAGAGGTPEQREGWMNTVAHEIGHVFFEAGHPNNGDGCAPLPGTDHMMRLMHNGFGHVGGSQLRRQCVKAEWDKAEEWLSSKIDIPQP